VELVRKRRLREEYSVLWILTGIGICVLAVWYGLLKKITAFIGAGLPTSTLFFFALIFLILLSLQFSVRISALHDQVKELAQKIALMEVKTPEGDEHSMTGPDASESSVGRAGLPSTHRSAGASSNAAPPIETSE
jgi:hypothetical protein